MSASRLPTRDLVAYGALALPLAALNLPLNVYVPTFYARQFGLDLAAIGLILLVARLIDIVTDPLIGELQDRSGSRFGRRKPWIAFSLPFLLLSSFMLFVPQPWFFGEIDLVYVIVWLSIAYLAWTIVQLGYSAWGAELSQDYHERSRIAGWREGFVIAGIMSAAALPALLGIDPGEPEALLALFVLMSAGVGLAALPLLFCIPDIAPKRTSNLELRAGLRLALTNRPFRQLISAYILNGLANGLPASLFLFFVEHRLGMPNSAGLLLMIYFASGIAAVPFWLRLSYRFGKHRTWAGAMLWACAVFSSVPLLDEGDFWFFAVICLCSGASLGADLALPVSMQADVVDLDSVRSGRRRTGLFFALWSMATKLALALAVGLAFPVLDWAGFDASSGENDAQALWALTALYALVPVLFKLMATGLVWRFEIDRHGQAELRRRLSSTGKERPSDNAGSPLIGEPSAKQAQHSS